MRTLIAVVLVALASPVLAKNCPYVNNTGDMVSFVDDGENTVTIKYANGAQTNCTWGVTGEISPVQDIECLDGTKAGFFFGSPTRNGDDQDLLIFGEDIYYRTCLQGA